MTAVKPDFVEYVRTMVRGDHEANDQIEARLDEQGWDGFPRFMSALFFLAIDRRFGSKIDKAKVITFVAEMRADVANDGPEIDGQAAETLIESIIDASVEYSIPQSMIGTIQAAAVYKVLTEDRLSDTALDAFLAEAEKLANREA
jgi:hypothetical protein